MSTTSHRLIDPTVPVQRVDPGELTRRAAHGDIALLLMCLVQITGDVSLLDEFGAKIEYDRTGSIMLFPPTSMQQETRQELVSRLASALDSEHQPGYLQVPDDESFGRMMALVTGLPFEAEYTAVTKEQAGFAPCYPDVPRADIAADFSVIVLGAGMTGIGAAIALGDAGIPYEVFEAGDDIGGTWRINTYPRVAVDTPSIYYSFSFEPEASWSRSYPFGAEYEDYLRRVVDKYDVKEHIRFGTKITAMTWDDATQEWVVEARAGDQAVVARANAVITAAGFLNRPKFPDAPGRERFGGESMHTAHWNHDVDLRGKRVAVIGAGATAVQVVDGIIDEVAQLTLFERQPHWVLPNYLGEGLVSEDEQWLQRNVPFYARWARARAYYYVSDRNYQMVRADPEWMKTHPLSISEPNDRLLQMCLGYLQARFGDNPALRDKLTPNFPPHGKRIVRDPGGYYKALASDKAAVVSDPVAEILPDGIRTADGTVIELDVIIYATGFTLDFLSTVDITGRGGVKLSEQWANQDPRSYLGGTVPSFPNLFVTSGPNSSNGHGGGHNFMTEVVVHYISSCINLLIDRGARSIEVTQQAQDEFLERVDAQMEGSVWRNALGAHTYYRNKTGRVFLPNPWRMVEYWQMLRQPDESKFVIR